jgi:hypothetical protein
VSSLLNFNHKTTIYRSKGFIQRIMIPHHAHRIEDNGVDMIQNAMSFAKPDHSMMSDLSQTETEHSTPQYNQMFSFSSNSSLFGNSWNNEPQSACSSICSSASTVASATFSSIPAMSAASCFGTSLSFDFPRNDSNVNRIRRKRPTSPSSPSPSPYERKFKFKFSSDPDSTSNGFAQIQAWGSQDLLAGNLATPTGLPPHQSYPSMMAQQPPFQPPSQPLARHAPAVAPWHLSSPTAQPSYRDAIVAAIAALITARGASPASNGPAFTVPDPAAAARPNPADQAAPAAARAREPVEEFSLGFGDPGYPRAARRGPGGSG